ncbi:MAG: right-handed parallel beta-helix repeat-containing protein [Rhizobiales bacterium]|nr:right-handed parallel beta-helix repeat-containing protein [Hyphomicrobiales bacterium]
MILVKPRSGTPVKTYFANVEVHNSSTFGIKSDGTNGAVDNAVTDSAFFSMAGAAVSAVTPAAASPGPPVVRVSLDRATVLNAGAGAVFANGGGSRVFIIKSAVEAASTGITAVNGGNVVLNDSVVTGNGTGVNYSGGGVVASFGNNAVQFTGFGACGADVCNGGVAGTMNALTPK